MTALVSYSGYQIPNVLINMKWGAQEKDRIIQSVVKFRVQQWLYVHVGIADDCFIVNSPRSSRSLLTRCRLNLTVSCYFLLQDTKSLGYEFWWIFGIFYLEWLLELGQLFVNLMHFWVQLASTSSLNNFFGDQQGKIGNLPDLDFLDCHFFQRWIQDNFFMNLKLFWENSCLWDTIVRKEANLAKPTRCIMKGQLRLLWLRLFWKG